MVISMYMIMKMNSKSCVTMKRVIISILAVAALLVGCSNEEGEHNANPTITIKANMSFDATSRTTIIEQDGNYLARWTSEDVYNIYLFCAGNEGDVSRIASHAIHIANDGATATFDFEMNSDMLSDSYTFVAVNGHTGMGFNPESIWLTLNNSQTQDWQSYYDTHADMIVSKPIEVKRPTGDLNLNFTMTRMNALLKLSFKDLELAEGDAMRSVTFACEQPIAGTICSNLADLDGVTYPIPYDLDGTASNSITFELNGWKDCYLSTLPATLKAGESYTVTVTTTQGATYQKSATLPSDLKLTAGDITAVTVNMSGITPSNPNN